MSQNNRENSGPNLAEGEPDGPDSTAPGSKKLTKPTFTIEVIDIDGICGVY